MRLASVLLGVAWALMAALVLLLIFAGRATPEDLAQIDRMAREVGR